MRVKHLWMTVGAVLLTATGAWAQAPALTVEYYHLDALGSVRVVTDGAGAIVPTQDYRPFGEGENPASGTDGLRYTGKERDPGSGLDYRLSMCRISRLSRCL